MKRLAIVGAGGFGREVAQLAEVINSKSDSDLTVAGFFDEDHSTHGQSLLGYPVVGDSATLASGDAGETDAYVLAIGSGQARRRLFDTMTLSALRPATLIHPSVDAHRSVIVGPGSVVCNGTALTVDIHIGPHVIVNLSSTIGHDVEVEAFTTLHPGTHISGNVHIGEGLRVRYRSNSASRYSNWSRSYCRSRCRSHKRRTAGCNSDGRSCPRGLVAICR